MSLDQQMIQPKPIWAENDLRLDPNQLPQMSRYTGGDVSHEITFTIHPNGVVLRRQLDQSDMPISMMLPIKAYCGIAARAMEDDDGNVTVTLELLHDDPALCVPLLVANHLDDIAADWRSWSQRFELPMLLFESDGVARRLEDTLGNVKKGPVMARRKGQFNNRHRPRFLARRKIGQLGMRLVVEGEEIIARS